jgi:hypothetical protein
MDFCVCVLYAKIHVLRFYESAVNVNAEYFNALQFPVPSLTACVRELIFVKYVQKSSFCFAVCLFT